MREPGRVLVVDDEPELCAVLAEFFAGKGLTVSTARDGSTALRLVREDPYQVVLLDMRMPGMDGLAVLRELRGLPDPPRVLMLSAVKDEAARREALALGADGYITKPFDLASLECSGLTKGIAILGDDPGQPDPA